MSWRRLSYKITQYLAIMLFLVTILLTTPWGTKLTLALLNNVDGVSIDYHSGSLIRDVQLNKFSLSLEQIELSVEGLVTKIDFSCVWKKALCIKSASADDFSLRYSTNADISATKTIDTDRANSAKTTTLFEMPFAININTITLKKARVSINETNILAQQLQTKVAFKRSQFNLLHPAVKQLTIHLESSTNSANNTLSLSQSLSNTVAELLDISLPLSLNIEKLKIDKIAVITKSIQDGQNQVKETSVWQSSNNQLSASWLKSDVRIRQFKTSTDTFSVTELSAEANLTTPYKIKSKVVSNIHHLAQWPELDDVNLQLSIQGSLKDLNAEITSTGSLTLTSAVQVDLTHSDMPFNITVNAEKIPLPLSLAEYGKPSSLSLALSGDLQTQNLEFSSLLTSYGYNNAQVSLAATHQEGHFSISELLIDEPDSASQLNLQGNVSLLPSNFSWQLSLQSTGISLPQINLGSLTALLPQAKSQEEKLSDLPLNLPETITGRVKGRITTAGSWSEKSWHAAIKNTDISGTLNKTPFEIKGDIGLTPSGHITQGKLLVSINNSELTLRSAEQSFWDLDGHLSVKNIDQWQRDIKGTVSSNFSVKGTKDNPTIRLSSKISKLSGANWQSDALTIEGVYSPKMDHQIELTVNNDQLTWINEDKTVDVNDFVLKLSGDAKKHQLKVDWLGDVTGQVVLSGQLNDTLTHWHSKIEKSNLAYKNMSFQGDKTFSLDFDFASSIGTIENHCWKSTGVSLCLPNRATFGQSGHVAANVAVDLSVIDKLFLPQDIHLISELNGDIKAAWSLQQPIKVTADFSLSPGFVTVSDDFNEHVLSQWSQGSFSFVYDKQRITNKIQLIDTDEQPLININANISLTDDFPVDAQIKLYELDLQPFQSILTKVVNLQGKLSSNITVNGTLAAPIMNGDIKLNKGKVILEQNANIIDNLSSTFVITNNKAAVLGNFFLEGNEAIITGQISWQDNLTINLDLDAKALPFVFPPQLMMNIAPKLNFSFKESALSVSGNIDVLEGSYNIDKLPEDSVPFSDDVIIVDQNGKTVAKTNASLNITTNVNVNIAKAFKVTGQGLQSQLLGQLQISQQEKQPLQLYGRIQSENGIYQAYGQKLKIEKGDISFNGPTKNPYIDLRASKKIETEDITVGIQVNGLADALSMQLYSSPTMQTPEILSYLVRGRGLDSNTDNSTTAAGLLVGMSITNNIGLFEQIEKLPLINNLALDTEGVGDQTQATVSGYVGNRVYLKYGIGVYEPINELTVRMYMFNRFWLEIVSGLEKSTDIYYSFDIE